MSYQQIIDGYSVFYNIKWEHKLKVQLNHLTLTLATGPQDFAQVIKGLVLVEFMI